MKSEPASGLNKTLLLFILFLDLVGFTLIFPLVPDLLEHYLQSAKESGIDAWLLSVRSFANGFLPASRTNEDDVIILLGGALAAVYSLLQFLAAPHWGRLSDRLGRRPVLIVTSAGLAVSHLFWFLSPNFTAFVCARLFGGLMAGNMGVASAAMADLSRPEERTRAMGLVGAAFGLGFILGPVIGGLTAHISLQGLAFAPDWIGPFAAPALAAFLLSALSAILNFLFFAETSGNRAQREAAWIENPFKVLREALRNTSFDRIVFINFIYIFIFSAYEFTFTFLFKLEFRLTPLQIGLVFLYVGVLLVLGQGGLVRALSKRFSPRTILLTGLALMPAPAYLLSLTPPAVGLALLCLAPIAAGSSLVQPALAGLASLAAPESQQGLALSLLRSFGSLGRSLGPLAGAYLYWFLGANVAYLLIGGALLGLLAYSLRLPRDKAHAVT